MAVACDVVDVAGARKRWRNWAGVWAAVAAAACTPSPSPQIRTVTGFAQGTTYSLQWLDGGGEAEIRAAAERELERIDALLSNYRSDSTLETFNAMRTTAAIELPAELVALFGVAKTVHAASDGCFDPTVRPLVRAWGFDGDTPTVPPPAVIDAALTTVGLDKLELVDATHVRKARVDLEIDMASIGQGYTAGRLGDLLEQHGSTNYLAEIGGEVVTRGAKPGGLPWRIGVEDPVSGGAPGPALRMPAESRTAAITSGSYRHYLEADGKRFGHIIDPRTGWAVEHDLLSVTVVGADAAESAAWATALLCLGPTAALETAERENLAALLWTGDGSRPATLEVSRALASWGGLLAPPAR
ncbi:MAG TPA: FAD:protein FMN transferase [Gammaproteobacteria bacterium]|nr:FAD:protein FMN transferase [Gammaproteobacteria bacterium]